MSTKITNNLKVHGENTTQKYTDAQYNTDIQRINGAQPGTPISSKLINTGLRNATLVTSALIEALKTVVPNDNDLITPITVGTDTTYEALVAALTEALVKIKVENAVLADNVKSGAIVEETTTAREAKQGYGISLGLNSKLQFKISWVGTHKNNDVLYYSVAGPLKGFYIVKGLTNETTTQPAGTLTISSGDTPTTHAAYLQRLTFETAISVDTGLSKTDIINESSTTNQLATAKAVYDYAQPIIPSGSDNEILVKSTTAGIVNSLTKVTSIGTTPTNTQIPSALAVKNYTDTKVAERLSNGTLIGTYTNNQTIDKSTLTGYKFLLFELKKLTTGYNGNFYGDSVITTPDVFYYFYQAGSPKRWVGYDFAESESFVLDMSKLGMSSNVEFANFLNANYPATEYNTGDWARNAYNNTPVQYVYAKVEGSGLPTITQNGGIRLAQFDGSTLTYATVTSISATQVRLNCDTTYNLRVWGFN